MKRLLVLALMIATWPAQSWAGVNPDGVAVIVGNMAPSYLVVMYGNGQGVPHVFIRAHMWWNIAAPEQIKEARKRATELQS